MGNRWTRVRMDRTYDVEVENPPSPLRIDYDCNFVQIVASGSYGYGSVIHIQLPTGPAPECSPGALACGRAVPPGGFELAPLHTIVSLCGGATYAFCADCQDQQRRSM